MKKIISTLLAVSLLVSLAVPAFASSTSSQSGDPSKVKTVAFDKSSYTIPKNSEIDFANEVSAFVDKTQLVLDANLTFELTNDTTGTFAISGSTVYAAESTGSATLVAHNIDGKIVGSMKISAGAQKPERQATGFKLEYGTYNIPRFVSSSGTITEIKATGKINSGGSDSTTQTNVTLHVGSGTLTKMYDTDYNLNSGLKNNEIIAIFDNQIIIIDGVQYKITTTQVPNPTRTVMAETLTLTELEGPNGFSGKSLEGQSVQLTCDYPSFGGNNTHPAVETQAPSGGGSGDTQAVEIIAVSQPKDAVFTAEQQTAINGLMETLYQQAAGLNVSTEVVHESGKPDKVVIAKNANRSPLGSVVTIKEVVSFPTNSNNSTRDITINAKFESVPAVKAKTIAMPSTMTLEVGEKFTIAPNTSPSNINQDYTISWSEDVIGNNDVYDYAIVSNEVVDGVEMSNGVITAVAVGSNKIVGNLQVNGVTVGTTTMTVNVVAEGTKPVDPTTQPSLNPTVNMIVGTTHPIVVKNIGNSAVTFSSYHADIATVAADGTIKAMAQGTTKIQVMIDGSETLYVTVNVKNMPAPGDVTKPTTPPSTGV